LESLVIGFPVEFLRNQKFVPAWLLVGKVIIESAPALEVLEEFFDLPLVVALGNVELD
jgi:hypothetical protein